MQPDARALELLPDFIVLAELDVAAQELIVRYASPAAATLLGRPTSEMVGKPLRSLTLDSTPFSTPEQRQQFFSQFQAQTWLEFPVIVGRRYGRSEHRDLRVRLGWPPGQPYVLVVGEDVTASRQTQQRADASQRLRAASELSGLLSHHINNALASALLNVEVAKSSLDGTSPGQSGATSMLREASDAIGAAAEVLSALATARDADREVARTSDLGRALEQVMRTTVELRAAGVEIDAPEPPYWVVGGPRQLRTILQALLLHALHGASESLRVSVRREPVDRTTRVNVVGTGANDAWMRQLIDPGHPLASTGTVAVRLFAATLIHRAIGGRVELVGIDGAQPGIKLIFAEGAAGIDAQDATPLVVLVSADAPLRAIVTTLIAPGAVEHTDSVREGLARVMTHGNAIVICDVDTAGVTPAQLSAFTHAVEGLTQHNVIVATRSTGAAGPADLPWLRIPIEPARLRELIKLTTR